MPELGPDLALEWDAVKFVGDILLGTDGDLVGGETLKAAVLISLLTWRLADDDDDVTDTNGDRMGWWGDTYAANPGDLIGSRIWLLFRRSLTNALLNEIRQFVEEALAWMVEDGVADRVDVTVERLGLSTVVVIVNVTRGDGTELVLRFDNLWGELNA